MTDDVLAALREPDFLERPIAELQRVAKRFSKTPELAAAADVQRRIAVLSGFTIDYLIEILAPLLYRRGIGADLHAAPFGAMLTEIIDEKSAYHAFDPEITLLLPSHRDLRHAPPLSANTTECAAAAAKEMEEWRSIWARVQTPIIQLTFDPPPYGVLGDADGLAPGGLLRHVRSVNAAIVEAAPDRVCFIDAERLATRLGEAVWHDARLYHLTKQPCAMDALPALADALAAACAGLMGRGRKVLALDLDNTLWGGEIGDAGLEGIELGDETPEGEAYRAFQAYVKSLRSRGVILAVCSKNRDELAREPFLRHDAMVLSLDDIACFVANFEDKASNLRDIAARLNVDTSALVFVDDSPVECAWIREALPEVETIHLTGDPSGFAAALDQANPFPAGRLTAEDLTRAESYTALGQVADGIAAAGDIDSFLAGLDPEVTIEPVAPGTVNRLVQLVAKTNQFKLNPRTFTMAELETRRDRVLALRLEDRFQDYGIVAVVVMESDGQDLIIDNWVMSCRVFSRRLEYLTRSLIAGIAESFGAKNLRLTYLASKKNGLVGELLPELGFHPSDTANTYSAPAKPPDGLPDSFATVKTRETVPSA
jgi:FkbH-like protein